MGGAMMRKRFPLSSMFALHASAMILAKPSAFTLVTIELPLLTFPPVVEPTFFKIGSSDVGSVLLLVPAPNWTLRSKEGPTFMRSKNLAAFHQGPDCVHQDPRGLLLRGPQTPYSSRKTGHRVRRGRIANSRPRHERSRVRGRG